MLHLLVGQQITVVDAFTDVAYGGNPAAVCVLGHPTTEAWMQAVAREMRHSETAFCIPSRDGSFELRWFTPGREVRLCGHAPRAADRARLPGPTADRGSRSCRVARGARR